MKLLKLFVLFTLIAYNVSAQLIYRKGTASGTDTYTVTVTPTFTAYYEDQRFLIEFTNANTGASTININSKGAISLVKEGGTELEADDIKAGEIKFLVYDGTNMQVVGGGGGAAVTASNGLTKTLDDIQLGGVMANTTQITGADGLLFQFILGDGSPSSTRFNLSNSQTQWTFSNSTGNRFIRNSSTGLIIEDGISGKGVEYSADYSSGFTDRSLIDFGTANSNYWKTNGTTSLTGSINIDADISEGIEFSNANGSKLLFNSTNVQLRYISTSNGLFQLSNVGAILRTGSGDGNTRSFEMTSSGIKIGDGITSRGAAYNADYSTNGISFHGNRWIPDYGAVKAYADTKLPKASTASTGTDVAFDIPRTYGYAADATGNITFTTTGLVEGITQLMIHNDSSEPTFESGMVVISGTYVTGVDNYIMMHAVKSNLILVTISQEQ